MHGYHWQERQCALDEALADAATKLEEVRAKQTRLFMEQDRLEKGKAGMSEVIGREWPRVRVRMSGCRSGAGRDGIQER